jgi:hypothetical protein
MPGLLVFVEIRLGFAGLSYVRRVCGIVEFDLVASDNLDPGAA